MSPVREDQCDHCDCDPTACNDARTCGNPDCPHRAPPVPDREQAIQWVADFLVSDEFQLSSLHRKDAERIVDALLPQPEGGRLCKCDGVGVEKQGGNPICHCGHSHGEHHDLGRDIGCCCVEGCGCAVFSPGQPDPEVETEAADRDELIWTTRDLHRAEDEVGRLREALWRCAELSGDDLSGWDGHEHAGDQLPVLAMQGVESLRRDYDDACQEVSLLSVSEVERLRAVEGAARAFVDHVEYWEHQPLERRLEVTEWRSRSHELYDALRAVLSEQEARNGR